MADVDMEREETVSETIKRAKKYLRNGCGYLHGSKGGPHSREFKEEAVLFDINNCLELTNRLHQKQKVGLARRVTRLAGSPFCDGSHPPSQANFSPYKHFGTPSRVNSVKTRQSEHA